MLAGMGVPVIKTLHDVARVNADLKVTCLACRHVAIFAVRPVIAYFLNRKWNVAWETVASRFRCGQCGSKRVECGIAPPVDRISLPKPRPDRQPSWREVKEHIKRTRG